jgi:hypothetical protein
MQHQLGVADPLQVGASVQRTGIYFSAGFGADERKQSCRLFLHAGSFDVSKTGTLI